MTALERELHHVGSQLATARRASDASRQRVVRLEAELSRIVPRTSSHDERSTSHVELSAMRAALSELEGELHAVSSLRRGPARPDPVQAQLRIAYLLESVACVCVYI